MFKALFNIMINLIATIIQIIVWPINALISSTLPDLSNQITFVTSNIGSLFSGFSYALGFIPDVLLGVLVFIVGVEIAKHTIFVSTHTLIKVWNVFQKIKFW